MAVASAGFVAALVADVLFLSGIFKFLRYHEYASSTRELTLTRRIGQRAAGLLVPVVPPIEASIAALVFIPATRVPGLAAACLAAVGFLSVIAMDKRPVIAHCGCWGTISPDIPK